MGEPNYQGVIALYNGVDAEQRVPFTNCTLARTDQYNYGQSIVQRGVLDYSLGNIRYGGDITIPLFDRQFVMLMRWILNSLESRVAVVYHPGLSHVYGSCRPTRARLSYDSGGYVSLNITVTALSRVEYNSAYTTPIGAASFPIDDLVTFNRATVTGSGIVNGEVGSFDLDLDNNVQEIWTANSWPISSDGVTAWYRKPFDTLYGGLTVTGSVNFLEPQSLLTNGLQASVLLGTHTLYLTRLVWQAGGFNISNPNERLKISVPFQSFASRQWFAAHV